MIIPDWTNIKDKLPDKEGCYIVFSDSPSNDFDIYFFDIRRQGFFDFYNCHDPFITHWTELPLSPNKKEKKPLLFLNRFELMDI